MQGNQDDGRYVLWNFRNLVGGTGTIEFRGIPEIHSGQETIHWILFAVGFLLLAQEKVRTATYCLAEGADAIDTRIG